jgi:hypothetical protein
VLVAVLPQASATSLGWPSQTATTSVTSADAPLDAAVRGDVHAARDLRTHPIACRLHAGRIADLAVQVHDVVVRIRAERAHHPGQLPRAGDAMQPAVVVVGHLDHRREALKARRRPALPAPRAR